MEIPTETIREDTPFRVALGIVVAAVAAVRTFYQIHARRSGPATQFESPLNIALRSVAGLAGIAILILYLAKPDLLAWAALPLPAWLRWLGVPLGVAGALLLAWVHRELGRNFSGTLHLRAEHTLVTSEPYRRTRHPMYTAFFGVVLSFFLLSAMANRWHLCWRADRGYDLARSQGRTYDEREIRLPVPGLGCAHWPFFPTFAPLIRLSLLLALLARTNLRRGARAHRFEPATANPVRGQARPFGALLRRRNRT